MKSFVPAFQIMDTFKLDGCVDLLHDIDDTLNTVRKLNNLRKGTLFFSTLFLPIENVIQNLF